MELQESSIFEKYEQVLKRRSIPALGVFIIVFAISLLALSLKKPSYVAEGKLRFQRINTTSSLTGVATEIGKLESVTQEKTNPLNTEAEVIHSIPVVQKTIDKLKLKDNKGKPLKPKQFIKQLTVADIQKTDVLDVSYKDTNPQTAAQVVNTLISVYLEYNIYSNRAQAAAARKFIEKQLPYAELVVHKAQTELAEFKEKNKVISLQEETVKAVDVSTRLQDQINEVQSKIADINAQSREIRKQLRMNSQQAVALTSVSQSPGIQDLLKEIQQVETQLAAKHTILQDNNPEILNLGSRLQRLKAIQQARVKQLLGRNRPKLNANLQMGQQQQQLSTDLIKLESTRQGLASQAATLSKQQTLFKQRVNTIPRLEQQQRQLDEKVQASQSTYSLLLQKLQESRIAENQNLGNATLVSQAQVPDQPISSPILSYITAVLLGTLAALAAIYILEAKDKSIKTVDEAKELLGLTLLGLIPSFSKSKTFSRGNEEAQLSTAKLVVRDTPRSPTSEAYRLLRANLSFTNADKELKVIVITSSVPKEGKSTVAANLAIAMAQRERKVLLVDGDLYCPTQHHIWNLPNSQGLSNVIVGQVDIKTALSKVIDNLYVLTSGVVPPNPASLLDSKRMAALMETFSSNYDFVIIDTPSLNVAADAATLGQMSDGVLLVVRPGVVNSTDATAARDLLQKSGQNILGQVVNGVVMKNERHSYYYFTEECQPQRMYEKSKKLC